MYGRPIPSLFSIEFILVYLCERRWKDWRCVSNSVTLHLVKVFASNETGVDLLNSIDDLLASGDTTTALFVIDLVNGLLQDPSETDKNDTEAKSERSQVYLKKEQPYSCLIYA